MEFLALIPARYSSTRFPGKPLAPVGGKPMVMHVYDRASALFGECYVATDDERIADTVRGLGGRVVMTSPDHRSGTDRCAEALEIVERESGKRYDVVLNVQGDEPFISPEHLESLAALFDDAQTSIGTLVRRFGPGDNVGDPNTPKVVLDRRGFALYFSRAVIPYEREKGAAEVLYYKHIGTYAYRADVLRAVAKMEPGTLETAESLEQLRWLENGIRIKTAEVTGDTLAVDTPADLEKANRYLAGLDEKATR